MAMLSDLYNEARYENQMNNAYEQYQKRVDRGDFIKLDEEKKDEKETSS